MSNKTNAMIAVPYMVEQNEPSNPIPRLIQVSETTSERDETLRNVFFEEFGIREGLTVSERSNGYGDIQVSWNDEMYVYFTYIK